MMNPRKLGIIAVGSCAAVLCLGSIVYARTGSVIPGSHRDRSAQVLHVSDDDPSSTSAADGSSSATGEGSSTSNGPDGSGTTAVSSSDSTAVGTTDGSTATSAGASSASSTGTGAGATTATTATTAAGHGADDATSSPSASGASSVATSAGSTATAAPATTVTSAEPATTAATEPATTAAPDTTPAPATTQPPKGESISIGKCWTNATATASGQLLISAKSSDSSATLSAYRSDGSLIGPVNNGFGGRYGGTVMPIQQHDPGTIIVKSDSGASASCHTTPFEVQP